ncbi:excisionase family DNA binding protein [Arthrobacter sp. CAN_A214]|uniref:helix-turn-helix domain-containing protein n=1 Tax=Arthrobacter sp. CAN_A214 TaxID=2787720 RepID=UPI0018C9E5FB
MGEDMMAGPFYTVSEVAATMRVSRMTVYRLVQSGAISGIRFGRSYRVPEAAVKQYLDSVNPGQRSAG